MQREAETRGAFPWNVKWQYMVENTPVGFRGQYNQASEPADRANDSREACARCDGREKRANQPRTPE